MHECALTHVEAEGVRVHEAQPMEQHLENVDIHHLKVISSAVVFNIVPMLKMLTIINTNCFQMVNWNHGIWVVFHFCAQRHTYLCV